MPLAVRRACPKENWRNIPITLTDRMNGVLSVNACLQQLTSGLPVIRPQLAIASGAFTYAADRTPFS